MKQATADAAQFVRRHGFAGTLSRTDVGTEVDCEINTSVRDTDPAIERILARQYNRALTLLRNNGSLLARISDMLARDGEVSRAALAEMLGLQVTEELAVLAPYAKRLSAFAQALLGQPELRPRLPAAARSPVSRMGIVETV